MISSGETPECTDEYPNLSYAAACGHPFLSEIYGLLHPRLQRKAASHVLLLWVVGPLGCSADVVTQANLFRDEDLPPLAVDADPWVCLWTSPWLLCCFLCQMGHLLMVENMRQ